MRFWKDGWLGVVGILIFPLASLALAVVGLVMYLETDAYYMLLIGCIMFIVCTLAFLTKLSRVILTGEGIELKYGKKQLVYIKWFDVTKVDVSMLPRTWYLIFFSDEKRIDIALSPKLYQAIMDICPSIFVKTEIDNNSYIQNNIQYYQRRKRK